MDRIAAPHVRALKQILKEIYQYCQVPEAGVKTLKAI